MLAIIQSRIFCFLVCYLRIYRLNQAGCKTFSFILGGKYRLRVLENRVLREIFGSKGEEVTEKWR